MARLSSTKRRLGAAGLLGTLASCMSPSPNAVGVGEQPDFEPHRNPATLPTAPEPNRNAIPPELSPDNPDSLGTTRTPPAFPALPMDNPAIPPEPAPHVINPTLDERSLPEATPR